MKLKNSKINKLIVIMGPTAGGKTRLAAHIAHHTGSEIISADSRQVYRGMDIGTGKDLEDYNVGNQKIPYHLIDIREAGEKYNVFEFQHDFLEAYQDITSRNKPAILCGGTGLYIDAVTKGYRLLPVPPNPELRRKLAGKSLPELATLLSGYKKLHNTTDVDTHKRAIRAIEIADYYSNHPEADLHFPKFAPLFIGIKYSRENRRKRITQRLYQRIEAGMLDEVVDLHNRGISYEDLEYYGLEYKFIALFLKGELTKETMIEKLNIAIHQFAKRQMTWFRKMEREGNLIHWIEGEQSFDTKLARALEIIKTFD